MPQEAGEGEGWYVGGRGAGLVGVWDMNWHILGEWDGDWDL